MGKKDKRFEYLKSCGLFSTKVIKNFLKEKDEKELLEITNPKPKLTPV